MIPIIINNFNRLSSTKKLVEDLWILGYKNIHILDNGSDYPPLMDWYKEVEKDIDIVRLTNLGPRALWDSGYISKFKSLPWIAYTDSDIELNPKINPSFIQKLIRVSQIYGVPKVGFALDISDLPDSYMGDKVREWESQFWKKELDTNIYEADIDTTFSIIQPWRPFDYKAIRVAGNFTAKHLPWHTDFNNLTEEEKYIMDRINSRFSTWKGYYLQTFNN